LGLGLTAGLNLYATVFATGLALRLGWIDLPQSLNGLHVLASPLVLAVAGVLYIVEFVADKIPAVEHAWDAVHTLIRPLGATWIAWTAMRGTTLETPAQVAVLLLVGTLTTSAHFGKAGTRVVSSASGGHLFGMNAILSLGEDLFSLVVAPLAIAHPLVALTFALVVVLLLLTVVAVGYRYLRSWLRPRPAVSAGMPARNAR
jgi:hypothetical protein